MWCSYHREDEKLMARICCRMISHCSQVSHFTTEHWTSNTQELFVTVLVYHKEHGETVVLIPFFLCPSLWFYTWDNRLCLPRVTWWVSCKCIKELQTSHLWKSSQGHGTPHCKCRSLCLKNGLFFKGLGHSFQLKRVACTGVIHLWNYSGTALCK